MKYYQEITNQSIRTWEVELWILDTIENKFWGSFWTKIEKVINSDKFIWELIKIFCDKLWDFYKQFWITLPENYIEEPYYWVWFDLLNRALYKTFDQIQIPAYKENKVLIPKDIVILIHEFIHANIKTSLKYYFNNWAHIIRKNGFSLNYFRDFWNGRKMIFIDYLDYINEWFVETIAQLYFQFLSENSYEFCNLCNNNCIDVNSYTDENVYINQRKEVQKIVKLISQHEKITEQEVFNNLIRLLFEWDITWFLKEIAEKTENPKYLISKLKNKASIEKEKKFNKKRIEVPEIKYTFE